MVEIDVSEGSGDDIGCCEDKGVGGEALSDVEGLVVGYGVGDGEGEGVGATYPMGVNLSLSALGDGLASGYYQGDYWNDDILYMPLNVAYGLPFDFYWIQFIIDFYPNNAVGWRLSVYESNTQNFVNFQIDLDYTVNDVYYFKAEPYGSYNIRFTLTDTTAQGQPTYTHYVGVPSTQMLGKLGAFSPASAVEGYTTNSQLTNVPYFMTYVGYQIPAHYHYNNVDWGSSMPSGIGTKVWAAGDHYYWAMLSDFYLASATGYQYNYGWVENPQYLVGSTVDNNFAHMYEPFIGSTGYIYGSTNALSGGEVWINGYTPNIGWVEVYASYNYQDWWYVGDTVYYGSATAWHHVGTSLSPFKYIAVVAYNTGEGVEDQIYLDAVHVGNDL